VPQATEGTTIDTNLLYYGDNLDALRRDIPGESGQKTDALRLRAG
jgi:hypothetical protein